MTLINSTCVFAGAIPYTEIIKTSLPTCKLSGCNRPCFKEPNGHVHDFCGRTHAREYQSGKELDLYP